MEKSAICRKSNGSFAEGTDIKGDEYVIANCKRDCKKDYIMSVSWDFLIRGFASV